MASAANMANVEELVLIWLIVPTGVWNVLAMSISSNPAAINGGLVAKPARNSAVVIVDARVLVFVSVTLAPRLLSARGCELE